MSMIEELIGNTYLCTISKEFKNETYYTEEEFEVEILGTVQDPIVKLNGEIQDEYESIIQNIFWGNWDCKKKK